MFAPLGPLLMIAVDQYWEAIDPLARDVTGGIQIVAEEARAKTVAEALIIDPTNKLLRLVSEHFGKNRNTSFWREVMRQSNRVARRPHEFNVPTIDSSLIDRRDLNPLFPFRNSDFSFDFTNPSQFAPLASVRSAHLLNHHWEGALYDLNLLSTISTSWRNGITLGVGVTDGGDPAVDVKGTHPQHPDAEVMAWFIYDQIGVEFLRRLAHLIQSPRKQIDCLIIKPDSGKSTLFEALAMALGEGFIGINHANSVLHERFTGGLDALAERGLLILDEADKPKEYPEWLITAVCDDRISLEKKGKNRETVRRVGNLIFAGNDFPNISFVAGADSRIPNCHIATNAQAISWQTRMRLISREAVVYLATFLLEEGAHMRAGNDDGTTTLGRDAVGDWREAVASDVAKALRAVLDVENGERVSNDAIKRAIEDYEPGIKMPKTRALTKMMEKFFPNAVTEADIPDANLKRGRGRGYRNLKIITPDDTNC